MQNVKRVNVIFKITGGKELKYQFGDTEVFENIIKAANSTKHEIDLELLTTSDFENPKEIIAELSKRNKGYTTYGVVNLTVPDDQNHEDKKVLQELLKEYNIGWLETLDKTYSLQYLSLHQPWIGAGLTPAEYPADMEPYTEKDYAKHKPLVRRKKLPVESVFHLYLPKELELPPYTRSPKGKKLMDTILKAIDEGVAVFDFAGLDREPIELMTTNDISHEGFYAGVLLRYLSMEPVFDFSKPFNDIMQDIASAIRKSPVVYLYSDSRRDYPDASIHTIIYTIRETD